MSDAIREKLVDTVEHLMRTRGLARISTRDIARSAGLADGTLYNHFKSKDEIFLAVLQRRVPMFSEALQMLPLHVGQRTVRENLADVAMKTFDFYWQTAPLICSLFGDQEMLTQNRRAMQSKRIGPERSTELLIAYLAAEQRLGRVATDVHIEAAAGLFFGAIFQAAVLDHFLGRELDVEQGQERLNQIVITLLKGLAPSSVQGSPDMSTLS